MATGLEGIAANVSVTAAQAIHSLHKDESTRCAVNQILKSVVREICTLRSEGVGASIGAPSTRPSG